MAGPEISQDARDKTQENRSGLGFKVKPSVSKFSMHVSILAMPSRRKNPEFREALKRNNRIGMLNGSIIASKLWRPSSDGTDLEYHESTPEELLGYDFRRPEELKTRRKKEERQHFEGKLKVLDFDREGKIPADKATATGVYDWFDLEYFPKFRLLSVAEATKKGYIKKTTYREAYGEFYLDGKYSQALLEVGDQIVYQVTPKGNSVVFLSESRKDSFEPPRRRKRRRIVFNIFPKPAIVPV
jgi:hypothetical protein